MPLWGALPHTTDGVVDPEAKPKFLTKEEKYDTYATERGWTVAAGGNGNANAEREVLVAIGGLSDATKLHEANISSFNWYKLLSGPPWGDPGAPTYTYVAGGQLGIAVNFNEVVVVEPDAGTGGIPKIVVSNSDPTGTPLDFEYLDGSGTNRLIFASEDYDGESEEGPQVGAVLSIESHVMMGNLNGATIKDADGVDAVLWNTDDLGAGTVTVA